MMPQSPKHIRSLCKAQLRSLCINPRDRRMGTNTYWGRGAVDRADIIVIAVRRLGVSRTGRERMQLCGIALVLDLYLSELYLDLICGSGSGVSCLRKWKQSEGHA